MKLRYKLIIDAFLIIGLLVLTDYALTGGFVHELLGMIILAGIIIHAFMNRRYYDAAYIMLADGRGTVKDRISYGINIVLPVLACVMLISSAAISQNLLPALSARVGNYVFWSALHRYSAAALLVTVFAHVCMHAGLFMTLVRKAVRSEDTVRAWRAGMRLTAVLMAVIVIRASYASMTGAAESLPAGDPITEAPEAGNEYDQIIDNDTEDSVDEPETDSRQDYITEPEPETDGEADVTLEEYLGSLFCNGCGRHCSLLSPKCGKGEHQAMKAESEYHAVYG